MWDCELKTRLSDIVSHLRNNCRQIVIISVFFFSYFIQLCDSRKIHYLTRDFRVKLLLKTDIALRRENPLKLFYYQTFFETWPD